MTRLRTAADASREKNRTSLKSPMRLMAVAGFGIAAAIGPAWPAVPTYSITDLGTLGGTTSLAYGINDLGQIVGQAYLRNGQAHATLFDSTGRGNNLDLGTLLGGHSSVARAINNLPGGGIIVGSSTNAHGNTHAVAFGFGSQVIDLDTLYSNQIYSTAYDISDAGPFGLIVGYGDYTCCNIDIAPEPIGIVFGLPFAPPAFCCPSRKAELSSVHGGIFSQAFAINSAGQAVGAWFGPRTGNRPRAALWTIRPSPNSAGAVAIDLGGFTADKASEAQDINYLGQIVGWSELPNGLLRATLFDPTGAGRNLSLGTLYRGGSVALAINDRPGGGLIVGYSCLDTCYEGSPHNRAVLFGFGGQIIDLNTLIDPTDALSGQVTLLEATDINNVGEGQITANGVFRGQSAGRAFLLTPLPASP